MPDPESFEVTEYGDGDEGAYERLSTVLQIVQDTERTSPAHAVMGTVVGDELLLKYHCYEMHLPSRMKQVDAAANDVFRETVSRLKKEFKRLTGSELTLVEQKDRADRSAQKVSMNERYYVIYCRYYKMG